MGRKLKCMPKQHLGPVRVLYSSSSHDTTGPKPNIMLAFIPQLLSQHDEIQLSILYVYFKKCFTNDTTLH